MKFILILSVLLSISFAHPFSTEVKPGVQPNTHENLQKLQNLPNVPAWIHSGQFQGDIILTEEQAQNINSRNGLIGQVSRWPKVVPYVLSPFYTWEEQAYIRKALDQLELLSCLKFVWRTDEEDYVDFTDEEGGCFAYVGRLGGKQRLNISPGYNGVIGTGCMSTGTIQHEMLHTLGFYHMQSSHDRDDYVEIMWDNISELSKHNFEKYNDTVVTHFDVPYDYRSVMHYHKLSFAIDWEKPTIVTKDPAYEDVIGQDIALSRRDIERLNRMYECPLE